jgi:hypothetical protein
LFESPLHRLKAQCLADDNAPAAREHLDAARRLAAAQHAPLFARQIPRS